MFKRILVPVDLNEPDFSESAVEMAIREARLDKGEIHVMTVMPGFNSPLVAGYFDADAVEKAREAVKAQLKSFAANRLPADLPHSLSVHEGQPADRIIHQAEHMGADLIILTAHHRSHLQEVLLGSNASRVVERAACSVLILRGGKG